jgi:serine/threonine protein kinase
VEQLNLLERLRRNRALIEPLLDNPGSPVGGSLSPAAVTDVVTEVLPDDCPPTDYQAEAEAAPPGGGERMLGQYRIREELGRGGMGTVYKAEHVVMGRTVAVKVISPELLAEAQARNLFRREVRAATRLVHPNVVMAFDASESDGVHFLVMEYVDGMTLDAWVRQNGPPPVGRLCELMRQTALALGHAAEQGLVHRDIKPSNLLVPRDAGLGEPVLGALTQPRSPVPLVKVADFGLARLHGTADGDTIAVKTGAGLVGTPDYISPEQARNVHSVDPRSDLYSLGCAFYFALAGRVPFPGASPFDKMLKHLMDEAPPVERFRPDVPPPVAAIVRRLMAKEPGDRFQSAAELAEALAPYCDPPPSWPAVVPPRSTAGDTGNDGLRNGFHSPVPTPGPFSVPTPGPGRAGLEQTVITAEEPAITAEEPAPVPLPPPSPAAEKAFRRTWGRWLKVIHAYAHGRSDHGLDGRQYREVHRDLLAGVQARVLAAAGERRAQWEALEEAARPWLALPTVARTDRDILATLLVRCQGLGEELGAGRGRRRWNWWAIGGLLLPVLLGTLYGVTSQLPPPETVRVAQGVAQGAGHQVMTWLGHLGAYVRAHPTMWASVAIPLIAAAGIRMLMRPRAD